VGVVSGHSGAATPQTETFEQYAAHNESARFTDWLRERSEPQWTAATTHRFTQQLGDGTLDEAVFSRYLIQDYAFVDTLVGVFGYAVGQAPTMADKRRLVEFLDTVTDDENDYFERSFAALGVAVSNQQSPEPTAATDGLIDLLLAARAQGGYAETLAVLVPAEWIYLSWATAEADDRPEQWYFDEWIELHANPGFRAFVTWLREQLDTVGPTLSERRQQRVARLFSRTVQYEVAFFESAYDPE